MLENGKATLTRVDPPSHMRRGAAPVVAGTRSGHRAWDHLLARARRRARCRRSSGATYCEDAESIGQRAAPAEGGEDLAGRPPLDGELAHHGRPPPTPPGRARRARARTGARQVDGVHDQLDRAGERGRWRRAASPKRDEKAAAGRRAVHQGDDPRRQRGELAGGRSTPGDAQLPPRPGGRARPRPVGAGRCRAARGSRWPRRATGSVVGSPGLPASGCGDRQVLLHGGKGTAGVPGQLAHRPHAEARAGPTGRAHLGRRRPGTTRPPPRRRRARRPSRRPAGAGAVMTGALPPDGAPTPARRPPPPARGGPTAARRSARSARSSSSSSGAMHLAGGQRQEQVGQGRVAGQDRAVEVGADHPARPRTLGAVTRRRCRCPARTTARGAAPGPTPGDAPRGSRTR